MIRHRAPRHEVECSGVLHCVLHWLMVECCLLIIVGVPTLISHRSQTLPHGITMLNPSEFGRYRSKFGSQRVPPPLLWGSLRPQPMQARSCLSSIGRKSCLYAIVASSYTPKVCKHKRQQPTMNNQQPTNNDNSNKNQQKSKKYQHSVLVFKVFWNEI